MVNLAKWLIKIKIIKKEKLKNITYRAARFAPANKALRKFIESNNLECGIYGGFSAFPISQLILFLDTLILQLSRAPLIRTTQKIWALRELFE